MIDHFVLGLPCEGHEPHPGHVEASHSGCEKDEDGWADVGHGVMDWTAIMAALRKTNARWFVMEHDNPKDHSRFASRSIETARGL